MRNKQAKSTRNAKAADKAKADNKRNSCVCGCGTKVRHLFAQGHDQRVRGMLQRGQTNDTLAKAIRAGLLKRLHGEDVKPNVRLLTRAA
jgi:hypothetical protein